MSLPSSDDLKKLDIATLAAPFADVSIGSTTTLDAAFLGAPFVGAYGTSGGYVGVNESSATLPAVIATAGSGNSSGPAGSSDLSLPAIIAFGAAHTPVTLPAITGEGHGVAGGVGGGYADLPAITASGHVLVGLIGGSSATLPSIEGIGYGPPISAQTLPSMTGTATGMGGQVGRSAITLSVIDGSGTGAVPIIGRSSLALSPVTVSGSGYSSVIGVSDVTLKSLIVASSGVSGRVGSSAVTLPVLLADGSGHVQVVGSSTVTLPSIVATGTAALAVGATYQGYALQTQSQALTTYSSVPFNSFARFNGVYLAAGPGGLFVLEGDTDAGAFIAASARVGVTDFGDPHLKHVDSMYVNYRTDGELSLKVITDDTAEYEYPLTAHGGETLNTTRARIGKGAKGVYWQFELANVEGADFAFDRMEPMPAKTTRRIA